MDGYRGTNYCYTIAIIEFELLDMLSGKALRGFEDTQASNNRQRRRKASKGTVSIGTSNGWLRLYWTYQGKRDHCYLGAKDTPTNRELAQNRAELLAVDLKNGTFDPTKEKYRLFPKQEVVQRATEPKRIDDLWEWYRKGYRFDAESTEDGYRYALRKLKEFWGDRPIQGFREEDGFRFVDWLMEKSLSQETRKSYLYRIRDVWQWAARRGYGVEADPWTEAIKGVKLTQRLPSPFTRTEIDELIQVFQTDERLAHYADYVRVALNLGCRPGELLGLRWKHVAKDFSRVDIVEQLTRKKERKLPKKGKTRAIPLNETVKDILKRRWDAVCVSQGGEPPSPDSLIFTSVRGKAIHTGNFRKRYWRLALELAEIRYQKPYTTRISRISHSVEEGESIGSISAVSGNTPETILRRYVGNVNPDIKLSNF